MKNITPNHGITQNHGMAAPTRRNVLKSAATFAALAAIGGAGRAAAADAEPEIVMDGHVAIGLDMVAGRVIDHDTPPAAPFIFMTLPI
jgi:hypothetical protein